MPNEWSRGDFVKILDSARVCQIGFSLSSLTECDAKATIVERNSLK